MFRSVFCIFLFLVTLTVFGNNLQPVAKTNLLAQHLNATTQILLHAPEAFYGEEEGRFYVDESTFINTPEGDVLLLSNGNALPIPRRLVDEKGAYLVSSLADSHKPFRCVCLACGHRWIGNGLTWRCERVQCRSTNISFESNPDWP